MSTSYWTQTPMTVEKAMELSGWEDAGLPDKDKPYPFGTRRLIKNAQYVWAYPKSNGHIEFVRFGNNIPDDLVDKLDLIEEP